MIPLHCLFIDTFLQRYLQCSVAIAYLHPFPSLISIELLLFILECCHCINIILLIHLVFIIHIVEYFFSKFFGYVVVVYYYYTALNGKY